MALLEPVPPMDLYQSDWPIWSHSRRLPPARTVASRKGNEGLFVNSIVSNGTVITGGAVTHSVLCPRVRINDSAYGLGCALQSDGKILLAGTTDVSGNPNVPFLLRLHAD